MLVGSRALQQNTLNPVVCFMCPMPTTCFGAAAWYICNTDFAGRRSYGMTGQIDKNSVVKFIFVILYVPPSPYKLMAIIAPPADTRYPLASETPDRLE
jgi:hypothetical protein